MIKIETSFGIKNGRLNRIPHFEAKQEFLPPCIIKVRIMFSHESMAFLVHPDLDVPNPGLSAL
jgi:hypothetical protein